MALHTGGDTMPLYHRLAGRLRARLAGGGYASGARLPSEGALSREFAVSRITVRSALDYLAAEGLVCRERGRGTFVATPPIELDLERFTDLAEDLAVGGFRHVSRVTHFAEEPAEGGIAAHLGLAPGTPIVRIDRLRLADERPLAFDRTYLPLRYGRLLDRAVLTTETILRRLERGFGIPILSGRYSIEVRIAERELSAALALAADDPMLLVQRTAFTTDDERVFFQRRYYRGDRVCYTLDLRRGTRENRTPAMLVARRQPSE